MKIVTFLCMFLFLLTSCQKQEMLPETPSPEIQLPAIDTAEEEKNQQEFTENHNESPVSQVIPLDLSTYFSDSQGTAVFLQPQGDLFVYEEEKAHTAYSPYSTFKIMSTLMGLEEGILTSLDSKMDYNGTIYWNSNWNQDVSLLEGFQTSCVWFFRQVLDKIQPNVVEEYLKAVSYGNCDVSLWEGSGKNPVSELNGFWLGSSLTISPVEQVYLLQQIFSLQSLFQKEHISTLKTCMETEIPTIYGKTGGGNGESWFVGFQEVLNQDSGDSEPLYFTFYLESSETSSQTAKEVALSVFSDDIM